MYGSRPAPKPFLALLLLLATLFASALSVASSVRQVGFTELVANSQLVFYGRVTDHRTRRTATSNELMTDVEFEVLDVFKGDAAPTRLVLSFAGGYDGEIRVLIHGLRLPAIGESGVYFAESLQRPQVNPLYGWTQGHYLARPDEDGVMRMHAVDGGKVTAADPAPDPDAIRLSRGTPDGVIVSRWDPDARAMTLAEFAAAIERAQEVRQ